MKLLFKTKLLSLVVEVKRSQCLILPRVAPILPTQAIPELRLDYEKGIDRNSGLIGYRVADFDISMNMDMDTTSMAMSMATGTPTTPTDMAMSMSMSAATATSTDLNGMTGMGMTMSMSEMAMVFFTSFQTPLFSSAWTPTTQGQYAGTCVFLVVLTIILRLFIALKPIVESRFWSGNVSYTSHAQVIDDEQTTYPKGIPGARMRAVRRDVSKRWSGWRISAAAGRATYEVVIVGVGYLLYGFFPFLLCNLMVRLNFK